jgi:tetratricopeptide (TPR) repeat protein
MKQPLRTCGSALLLLLIAWSPCWASDHARTFLSALESYKEGDYAGAAAQFEALAQSGVHSGPLFYNLGNAYLKDDRLGPAILWYERAQKLMPHDADLRFNLQYARSLAKDAPEEVPASLLRIVFFWKFYLSQTTLIVLAVGFNMLFWMLAGIWYLTRRRAWFHAALGAGLGMLIFAATAGFDLVAAANPSQGIVLPDRISIRSGLEDHTTELFLLHAGARVRILDRRGEHVLVRFAPEKIGWVSRKSIGIVR